MKTQLPSLLRRWLKRLLTVLAAVAVAITFSGCPLDKLLSDILLRALFGLADTHSDKLAPIRFDHREVPVLLSPDEAVNGTTLVVTVTTQGIDTARTVTFDGEGITARKRTGDPVVPGQESFDVNIADNAPLRPFRVYVDQDLVFRTPNESVGTVGGSAWFYVHRINAGNAPRLTSLVAPSATPGTLVPVDIVGSNLGSDLDFSLRLVSDDPGFVPVRPTVTSSSTAIAYVPLPEDAFTGRAMFSVQTNAGRSAPLPLEIASGRAAPMLSGLFPNYGEIAKRTEVDIRGRGFTSGMEVRVAAGLVVREGGFLPERNSSLDQTAVFTPGGVPRREIVSVLTLGGVSNGVEFHVTPPGSRGPRIKEVEPNFVTAGAANQIKITWENLRNDAEPQLVAGGASTFVQPFISADVLRAPFHPDANYSIAIVDVAPIRGSRLYLAGRTADGLTTNSPKIFVFAADGAEPFVSSAHAEPFVSSAQIGRVPRGGSVVDTFFGERLAEVSRVSCSAPGMTGTIIGTPTANSVQVRISTTASTPLTGDALTTLKFLRRSGPTSQHLSYRVDLSASSGNEPRIDLLAPNWVAEGGGTALVVSGANFTANSTISYEPANAILSPSAVMFRDRNNLEQSFAYPTTGGLSVRVVTPGAGQSNRVDIEPINRDFRTGPEASFAGSEPVVGGSRSQVKIFGRFLVEGSVSSTSVIGLRTEAHGDLIASTSSRFFPKLGSDSPAGVVELETAEPPPPVAEEGAPAQFTLRRADGLTTHPFDINVLPAPTTGPFVSRVIPKDALASDLRRTKTETMRILGRGLSGVTELYFAQPGISIGEITVISDSEINVDFTAAADAVVTGEEITTVQVYDGVHDLSNNASFIVVP